MKIKDISPENRPRERLEKYGASALSDSELLAIILQQGTRGESAIDLSNRIISKYGIDKLSNLTLSELKSEKGIGLAKASQIKSLFELSKRTNIAAKEKASVKTARDVYEYAKELLDGKDREHILLLYLDSKNRINKHEIISMGTLNSSLIHPREIFKTAIRENTNAIIITHNHPSGDPAPSKDDREITKELVKAGEILEINVLDHVIIGKDSYYSFKERNQM